MPSLPTAALRATGATLLGPWSLWRRVWARREALGGELVPLAALVTMGVVHGLGYPLVVRAMQAAGGTVWDPATALDRWIPALPWTIALYSTMYVYPLGVFCAPKGEGGRAELLAFAQAQVLLAACSFVVYILFPAEIHLTAAMKARLEAEPELVRALFGWLYFIDRPWNAWPSLHISLSLFVVLCVRGWLRSEAPGRRAWMPRAGAARRTMAGLWLAWGAMALSILTTKQHFVWDLVTGAALALGLWRAYYLPAAARARAALTGTA